MEYGLVTLQARFHWEEEHLACHQSFRGREGAADHIDQRISHEQNKNGQKEINNPQIDFVSPGKPNLVAHFHRRRG